jgi:hypothetical protein
LILSDLKEALLLFSFNRVKILRYSEVELLGFFVSQRIKNSNPSYTKLSSDKNIYTWQNKIYFYFWEIIYTIMAILKLSASIEKKKRKKR